MRASGGARKSCARPCSRWSITSVTLPYVKRWLRRPSYIDDVESAWSAWSPIKRVSCCDERHQTTRRQAIEVMNAVMDVRESALSLKASSWFSDSLTRHWVWQQPCEEAVTHFFYIRTRNFKLSLGVLKFWAVFRLKCSYFVLNFLLDITTVFIIKTTLNTCM